MRVFFLLLIIAVLSSILLFRDTEAVGCGEPLWYSWEVCGDEQCSWNVSGYCLRGKEKGDNCTTSEECYEGLDCENGLCHKKPAGSKSVILGLVAAAVSVLCFGSSFVPVKRFKKYFGDGQFAQFAMCFGRFAVGVVVGLARPETVFYPDAALGGAFWALGNILSVPIIQCIGMGLGIAIWGTTNMLLGWASGHFGWWGIPVEHSKIPWLAYFGVVLSFLSIILFVFVEPHRQVTKQIVLADEETETSPTLKKNKSTTGTSPASSPKEQEERKPSIQRNSNESPTSTEETPLVQVSATEQAPALGPRPTFADSIGKNRARILGVSMALVAGTLYGICMDPAQYLMKNNAELSRTKNMKYSPSGLDYVFSSNVGSMFTSWCCLVIYQTFRAVGVKPSDRFFDQPQHEKILLPAFTNGIIGACGSAAWFIVNQNLGLVVSFPIIAAGPGVVSALWGVLVFKEISGMRNFLLLGAAFLCVIASAVTTAISKGND